MNRFHGKIQNRTFLKRLCQALSNAVARNGKPKELIFYSDRGCQYSSRKYRQVLEDYRIRGSMSKPGYPYDNSCMESFYAGMKKGYILRREYEAVSGSYAYDWVVENGYDYVVIDQMN
ncbi:MAG: DDE-type integrase/transposase/recombinase [Clostridia bacterium]|nr:DDE-type integrase/transposase/recombinase [Clostridia bacterium]